MNNAREENGRRGFLQAAGTGLLILKPETVFGSQANSAIEFGLVGCGSRGTMIAGMFVEHTGARLVALGDAMPGRPEAVAAVSGPINRHRN